MARIVSVLAFFALTACAGAIPRQSQSACTLPTTNEWLKQAPATDWARFARVDASLVQQVSNDVPSAVALLANEDAVQLSPEQVQRFAGRPPEDVPSGTAAYLVRAVFPTGRPSVSVGWYQNDLHVFAGGLGCAQYEKRPIIVYLGRHPHNVFVSASAAL